MFPIIKVNEKKWIEIFLLKKKNKYTKKKNFWILIQIWKNSKKKNEQKKNMIECVWVGRSVWKIAWKIKFNREWIYLSIYVYMDIHTNIHICLYIYIIDTLTNTYR